MKKQKTGSGMKHLALSVTFFATSLASITTYGADGVLRGRVTDKADGEGVVGAAVSIAGTNIATATDIDGNFVLRNVPPQQQKITVNSIGYAPTTQVITLADGQTATINFTLGQTTIMASEVVVGAALYKQDRLEVPVTANVVSKEKIKEEPSASLDKVIEDVPGVNINRSAGYSTSTVQIRGSNTFQGGAIGTRVNSFYDGFPINTPETGEVVWKTVSMNAADKVEVLKGAAATLYGSGAMGGVVNVSGSMPDKMTTKAGFSGGFYDAPPSSDNSSYRNGYTPWLWNTYVGLGNKSGKWTYNLLYSHGEDDGYRENTSTNLDDVKLKLRYDIDAKQYLQLSSFYNETKGGYATIWPYNMTITGFSPLTGPIFSFTPYTDQAYNLTDVDYTDDIIKRKNALVGVNYVNLLSDKLSLDTKIYYTHNSSRVEYNPTDTRQQFGFSFLIPGGPPFPVTYYLYDRMPGEFNETSSNRYGAGLKIDWKTKDNHRLLFGFDSNVTDVQSTQYTAEVQEFNKLKDIQERNFAFFAQDEWKVSSKLTALLSARYDWSGIDADEVSYIDYLIDPNPTTPTVAPIEHKSVDAVSPRVALNYKAADDMSFRASFGKSFRAPTLAERFVRDAGIIGDGNPNPALDKETMTAYELGVFKQFGDKVSLDIAGYINNYDNLIESRTIGQDDAVSIFEYQNVAKARIWGIETSINYRPTTDWTLSAGYAYMNAKDKSDQPSALAASNPDGEWLAYRPEHTASASAIWKTTKKLTMNVNGRYVSLYKAISSFYAANTAGNNYPGGFIVMNAGVKYQFTDSISASFNCKNIGNVQYEEAEWFRSPGRSYVAGIDLTY